MRLHHESSTGLSGEEASGLAPLTTGCNFHLIELVEQFLDTNSLAARFGVSLLSPERAAGAHFQALASDSLWMKHLTGRRIE